MKKQPKTYCICLAGGSGTRMGSDTPKVLLPINNMPAICYSLSAFQECANIDGIILVCPKDMTDTYQLLCEQYSITKVHLVVAGGIDRTNSVYNGLSAINECDYVLVHDGARPMITTECINLLLETCKKHGSAVAAAPINNTIKRVIGSKISETINRENLWEVYTPQAFKFNLLKDAYRYIIKNNIPITDEASAMEACGNKSYIVDVGYRDFKLTTPSDIKLVERLLMKNNDIRMGLGYDVHRFAANRKLVLGGVEIPCDMGLTGHSDADVLTHAIMDGILGAAGLPDIGQLFPDSSSSYKDIYSINLLKMVIDKIDQLGYTINNIDAVIACELPKISPYRNEIIECLANAMHCEKNLINIKGTTTEKLGFEGRGEGISARCIVCLKTK